MACLEMPAVKVGCLLLYAELSFLFRQVAAKIWGTIVDIFVLNVLFRVAKSHVFRVLLCVVLFDNGILSLKLIYNCVIMAEKRGFFRIHAA